jgi:hypothetical protein
MSNPRCAKFCSLLTLTLGLVLGVPVGAANYDFLPVTIVGGSGKFLSPNNNGFILGTAAGTFPMPYNNTVWSSQFPNLFPASGTVQGYVSQYNNNAQFTVTFDLTGYSAPQNLVFGIWNITEETNTYSLAAYDINNNLIAPTFNWNFMGWDDDALAGNIGWFHITLDPGTGKLLTTQFNLSGTDTDAAFWNNISANTRKIVVTGRLGPANADGVVYYFAEPRPCIICPTNITVTGCGAGAVVYYPPPIVTGECGTNYTVTCNPTNGSFFPVGTNLVMCTGMGDPGHPDISCSFNVIVLSNGPAWKLHCPDPAVTISVTGCPPVMPNLSNVISITTNCAFTGTLNYSQFPPAGTTLTVGANGASVQICDNFGNCQLCEFNVTGVASDPFPPVITCPSNIVVLTCTTNVVVNYQVVATDNQGPPIVVCSPPSGSSFPLGTNLVYCTATDACGNTTNCQFYVIVKGYPPNTLSWNNPAATIYAGWPDLFALPPDPANLGPCIPSVFFGSTFKGFDATNNAQPVGHRFTSLPANIVKAFLIIRMKPGSAASSTNDKVYLGFGSGCTLASSVWNGLVSSLPGAGGTWQSGFNGPTTFVLDLSNLPGGTSLISKLNADQFLDAVIHDDTVVDYMQLRLWTCPPPGVGTGVGHNNNATNNTKLSYLPPLQLGPFGAVGSGPALAISPPDGGNVAGVEFELGGGPAFEFTMVLDMGAPLGATIEITDPSSGSSNSPSVMMTRDSRGWNMKVGKAAFTTDAGDYRVSAVNTNSELLDSFIQTHSQDATNPPVALVPETGITQFPVTLLLNAADGSITLSFPGSVNYRTCTYCPQKGWDGTITGQQQKSNVFHGRKAGEAQLDFVPVGPYTPSARSSLLLTTVGLSQLVFTDEMLGTMSAGTNKPSGGSGLGTGKVSFSDFNFVRKSGSDPEVYLRVSLAGDGVSFVSLADNSGIALDLGHSASVSLGIHHFDNGDIPTGSQEFRFSGPGNPLILTNRPSPPTNILAMIGGGPSGVQCAADFSSVGASNVTVQLWNNGALVASKGGMPATQSTTLLALDHWPERVAHSSATLGMTLVSSQPFAVSCCLDCGGCYGNELRIIPELPGGVSPVSYLNSLDCLASEGMESYVYDLQGSSACVPPPFSIGPSPTSGVTIQWSGVGFRLQGAESADGPWHELGDESPVNVGAAALVRLFRLVCQ